MKNSNIDDVMILYMFESDRIFSFNSHSGQKKKQSSQTIGNHLLKTNIIQSTVLRRVRLFKRLTRKMWYLWFVTWSHSISHLGGWLLHDSLRVIKLQPRFKVCNISYLYVLFHSSSLLLKFWYINHKKIKGKECIHVTICM